jgi:hypothetical protein
MRCFSIRATVVALVLVSSATASAQSLADVARREEERRKAVGTSGKVYTNDQLRPEPPASGAPVATPGSDAPATPAAPSTPAAGAPATGAPGGEAAKPGDQVAGSTDTPTTEEGWRKRVAAERDAVSRSQILADALQSRINALTTDFENRDDPAQRGVIAGDRQKALAELDRVKREIDQHQKAITAIQEEARRAGVPAGWTR